MNIERLKLAIAIIETVPEENLNLDSFVSRLASPEPRATCGTIACAAGWLGFHPEMNKLGLHLGPSPWGQKRLVPIFNGADRFHALAEFFETDWDTALDL